MASIALKTSMSTPLDSPRIAVLLAVYNGMKFLSAQLDSILNQAGVDIKVWVSIDSSADGSENWLIQKAILDPRITILPTGFKFGRAALNFFRLLREASLDGADYIALADQDDVWQTDKLLRAHTVLQSTGADGYSSNVTAFWEDGTQHLIVKSQPQRQWDFLFEAPGPGCTFVISIAMGLDIQRFIQNAPHSLQKVDFHDWLIYAYARSHGYQWHIDSYSGMLYRQHTHNQLGANTNLKSMWTRAMLVMQGHWLRQAKIIAQLIGWEHQPVVAQWFQGQRIGFLILATRFLQCRRRRRDQFLFAFSCIWMAFTPYKADRSSGNSS